LSEEITQRIKKENTAYCTCKVLVTSYLTNKYNTSNIYLTLIKPVVTHMWNLDIVRSGHK